MQEAFAPGRILQQMTKEGYAHLLRGSAISINIVNVTAESKRKAKVDPRDDLLPRFRAEEHTSPKKIDRYRQCRPNSDALIGMYARHHQRHDSHQYWEKEEECHRERLQHRKETPATFLVHHGMGRRGRGISSKPKGAVLADRGEKAST